MPRKARFSGEAGQRGLLFNVKRLPEKDVGGNGGNFIAFADDDFFAVRKVFDQSAYAQFEIPVVSVGGKHGIDAGEEFSLPVGDVDFSAGKQKIAGQMGDVHAFGVEDGVLFGIAYPLDDLDLIGAFFLLLGGFPDSPEFEAENDKRDEKDC